MRDLKTLWSLYKDYRLSCIQRDIDSLNKTLKLNLYWLEKYEAEHYSIYDSYPKLVVGKAKHHYKLTKSVAKMVRKIKKLKKLLS